MLSLLRINLNKMDKKQLRELEKEYKSKIDSVPKKHKGFWKRQLKYIQKKLYGNI